MMVETSFFLHVAKALTQYAEGSGFQPLPIGM